jgi:hypothetical protein
MIGGCVVAAWMNCFDASGTVVRQPRYLTNISLRMAHMYSCSVLAMFVYFVNYECFPACGVALVSASGALKVCLDLLLQLLLSLDA